MGGVKRRFHEFGVDSPAHIVVIAADAEVDPRRGSDPGSGFDWDRFLGMVSTMAVPLPKPQ